MEVDPEEKSMSALEYNIKNKGEVSYYYAHKNLFEEKEITGEAKTISGPGLITGGDPILLQSTKVEVEIIKEPKKITKYIFYDDDINAIIKMDLPEECKEITEDLVEARFQERAFDLKINVVNNDAYFFSIKKLYEKIIPEKSVTKIAKGKLVIIFRKQNEDVEWPKPSA